jgi:fructose-specific phosphotransferase system component IIB
MKVVAVCAFLIGVAFMACVLAEREIRLKRKSYMWRILRVVFFPVLNPLTLIALILACVYVSACAVGIALSFFANKLAAWTCAKLDKELPW